MGRLYPLRFVGPVLAIEAIFVAIPLATGFWYSLHRADYFEITAWRGLDNYWAVIQSPTVQRSLVATAVFTIFSLAFTFAAGLSLALFLERDTRLNVFARAVVLVPYMISMLVGSLLLKWLFSSDGGIMPLVLSPIGLGHATILGDPDAAMAALVFNAVWRDSAFAMILLLAGLKGIDPQLHAAARIDGASAFMRFRRLTLPLLRVPILITLVRLAKQP
jgi:ABC-type sugar transport system permease subunit